MTTGPAPAPAPTAAPTATASPSTAARAGSVNDTAFSYAGTWNTSAGGGTFRSQDRFTATPGNSYTLRFTGTQVALFASKDPRHGIAAVSVNGGAERFIDLYSATRADQVKVFTSRVLPRGTHTVRVRVTGWQNAKSGGSIVNADRMDVVG